MRKSIVLVALLAALSFGLAQITVAPTSGSGADQFNVGSHQAAVQQKVNLHLPPKVALHLDVSKLNFDLRQLGSDPTMRCVYGPDYRTTDEKVGKSTLPLGVYYGFASKWTDIDAPPAISLKGWKGQPIEVTQYPPAQFREGELIDGSKNYFVCFKTFVLQKFSNHGSFQLQVSRAGEQHYQMYIQDNTVCSVNDFVNGEGGVTGFYELAGSPVDLLPNKYTAGTTGSIAKCLDSGKSWLDDLVVVAVKVNGEHHGDNVETLTYTLTSPDPNGK